jgi:hypothetical protein
MNLSPWQLIILQMKVHDRQVWQVLNDVKNVNSKPYLTSTWGHRPEPLSSLTQSHSPVPWLQQSRRSAECTSYIDPTNTTIPDLQSVIGAWHQLWRLCNFNAIVMVSIAISVCLVVQRRKQLLTTHFVERCQLHPWKSLPWKNKA